MSCEKKKEKSTSKEQSSLLSSLRILERRESLSSHAFISSSKEVIVAKHQNNRFYNIKMKIMGCIAGL